VFFHPKPLKGLLLQLSETPANGEIPVHRINGKRNLCYTILFLLPMPGIQSLHGSMKISCENRSTEKYSEE